MTIGNLLQKVDIMQNSRNKPPGYLEEQLAIQRQADEKKERIILQKQSEDKERYLKCRNQNQRVTLRKFYQNP